jgi:hypothetical protein
VAEPIPNFVWKGEGMEQEAAVAGFRIWERDGVPVTVSGQGDAVSAWIASYNPLPRAKRKKIERLKEAAEPRISLFEMIDAGAATNITNAQFTTYLVAVTNRYRTIKAQINAATTVQEVEAVSLTTGWPANP